MAEYWKSQGKYWCTYCKIFIQDNNISRTRHDQGPRHKQNVHKHLSSLYDAEAARKSEAAEKAAMLAEMNAKAEVAYGNDLANMAAAGEINGLGRFGEEERRVYAKELRAKENEAKALEQERWRREQEATIKAKMDALGKKRVGESEAAESAQTEYPTTFVPDMVAASTHTDEQPTTEPVSTSTEPPIDQPTSLPIADQTSEPTIHPYGEWEVVIKDPTPTKPPPDTSALRERKNPKGPDLQLMIDEEEIGDYREFEFKEKKMMATAVEDDGVKGAEVIFKKRKSKMAGSTRKKIRK